MSVLYANVDGTGGSISSVNVAASSLYSTPPTATIDAGGAAVYAIARPHLRGRYQCCYRWYDDTPESRGGPRYSSVSPVFEFDAEEGAGGVQWNVPAPPVVNGRVLKVELWRTTSNQAYTLYRLPLGTTFDDLTDEELVDPDRKDFLAMPFLLPDGSLNATRFGVPPSDKAVAVFYQDRLWLGADTSGTAPNTLLYSETGEPESIPEINELIIQTNVNGHDHITALIPYGGSLGVMQSHHAYRLTYTVNPQIDASIQIAAFRGCLNQRCWDEHAGVIYCLDTEGVYSMDQAGRVEEISNGIDNLFWDQIDFSDSRWFSVAADKNRGVVRVAIRMKSDGPGDYPTRILCYSVAFKAWWEEVYPCPMVGAANLVDSTGYYRCFYGSSGGKVYAINEGNSDVADGNVSQVAVTDAGSGYTRPPKVTFPGDGCGAEAESVIDSDGRVTGIFVRLGGYGYSGMIDVEIEPPPPGGRQATAMAFAVSGDVPIPCIFKTGNMEYPSDSLSKDGNTDGSRNVAMLYTPTAGPSLLKLRMYYNNQDYPRANVVSRDRGTGAQYLTDEPAVAFDMDAGLLPEDVSSGVCRALFAGKTLDDARGNDRHVAVELSAKAEAASGPVTIHQLDVYGIPAPQQAQ